MNSNIFSFYEAPAAKERQNRLRVAIQPNMSCQGWPATSGSIALENYTALEDATVIRLLKQNGSKVVGSTHMSEFGLGLIGHTGSLAVLEDFADIALITDYIGEVRVAAACAGLIGFKPTYGIISRVGLIGLIPSMECWGILGRKVSEIRTVIKAICAGDENDFSMTGETLPDFNTGNSFNEAPRVIGVAKDYQNNLSKAERAAWEKVLSATEKTGIKIKEIKPIDAALCSSVHNVIGAVEASSSAGKFDGVRYGHRTSRAGNWNEMYLKSRGESFGTLIKTYLFQGAYFQFENYTAFENACRIRGDLLDEIMEILAQADWIASLTICEKKDAYKALNIEDIYKAFFFTAPSNVLGLPTIQIPGIAIDGNLDFGLQITGRPMSDPELLALGEYLGSKKKGGSE
jgi:aspartyl-tRNA(Asn)/glutamyl-tRNA(Gln) amidotransferase subunit A